MVEDILGGGALDDIADIVSSGGRIVVIIGEPDVLFAECPDIMETDPSFIGK